MGISNDKIEAALGRVSVIRKSNFIKETEATLKSVASAIVDNPLNVNQELDRLKDIYAEIAKFDKDLDGTALHDDIQNRLAQAIGEHVKILVDHADEMLMVMKEEEKS